MKKLFWVTTALIATTSVASAEITFNGEGRFGVVYTEQDDEDDVDFDETRLEQRFRLNIVGTTETDGGVLFGARGRLEAGEDSNSTTTGFGDNSNGAEFNVTAGGFRLDVGNTSDVFDSGDVFDLFGPGIGLTSFLELNTGAAYDTKGFNSSDDDPVVKARYTTGAFTVAASYQTNTDDDNPENWQIGAGYEINDNVRVGAAWGTSDPTDAEQDADPDVEDFDYWAIGVDGSFGALSYAVLIGDSDDQEDVNWGVGIGYAVGAATEVRFLVQDSGADDNDTSYGLGVRHSLGGGVSLRAGVGSVDDTDQADFGVVFSF